MRLVFSKKYRQILIYSVFTLFFLATGISFFVIRINQVTNNCNQKIINALSEPHWNPKKQLTQEEQELLTQAKYLYLYNSKKDCMREQKFFILF